MMVDQLLKSAHNPCTGLTTAEEDLYHRVSASSFSPCTWARLPSFRIAQ